MSIPAGCLQGSVTEKELKSGEIAFPGSPCGERVSAIVRCDASLEYFLAGFFEVALKVPVSERPVAFSVTEQGSLEIQVFPFDPFPSDQVTDRLTEILRERDFSGLVAFGDFFPEREEIGDLVTEHDIIE